MLSEDLEWRDLIVVPEVLTKHFIKEQILVPRSTETTKANASKSVNEGGDRLDDHPRGGGRYGENIYSVAKWD